jgi:hypothetical protein
MYLRAAREQRIAAGAHGWRLKLLPWLRNSPIVQQLETHDRVVAAMQVCPPRAAATTHPNLTLSQPGDRADPANLGAEAKSKIAQRSGCTLQQVNSVIKQARPPHPPPTTTLPRAPFIVPPPLTRPRFLRCRSWPAAPCTGGCSGSKSPAGLSPRATRTWRGSRRNQTT